MQNNVFKKINVSTRILMLMLLSLCILIANSIYFMLFLLIFIIILLILTDKNVKFYINAIKNVKFWLLFIFITYIIIFRNILDSFVFIYKVLLIVLIVKQFMLTVNFQNLTNGIMTLLKPLCKFLNLEKVTYNIVIFINFVKIYIDSRKKIFSNYEPNKKIFYCFSLKYNILPRLFFTMAKLNKLESSLKLKFYKSNFEEKNLISSITLFVFVMLFIGVIFKEVIL